MASPLLVISNRLAGVDAVGRLDLDVDRLNVQFMLPPKRLLNCGNAKWEAVRPREGPTAAATEPTRSTKEPGDFMIAMSPPPWTGSYARGTA
jgi:hypothetical protein